MKRLFFVFALFFSFSVFAGAETISFGFSDFGASPNGQRAYTSVKSITWPTTRTYLEFSYTGGTTDTSGIGVLIRNTSGSDGGRYWIARGGFTRIWSDIGDIVGVQGLQVMMDWYQNHPEYNGLFPIVVTYKSCPNTSVCSTSTCSTCNVTYCSSHAPHTCQCPYTARFEIEAVRVGDTYFLGKLKPEDRGVLVSRVYGYDIEEIRSCITAFQSETGRFAVYRTGVVVVVADRESVLRRISSMLSQLSRTSGNTWILQFFIVAQKKDLNLMYGSSVRTSGQVAYGLNDGSFSESDALSQSLNASFDSNSEFYDLRASPMLLLRDGSSGKWSDGVSVPVPQKTVSQYGVVTTTGFSYIDTGIVLSVSLRESVDGAFLKLDYQDSSIRGYVEYQPIIAKASLTSECSIQSSKIYLMGELVKRDEKDSATEVFNFKTERGGIKNQVFCRVFRVGSPYVKKPDWRKPTAEASAAVEPSAPKAGRIEP